MAVSKQVVRSPDGGISVQYLDADTGKQILGYNPSNYSPSNYAPAGTSAGGYAPQAYFGEGTKTPSPDISLEVPQGSVGEEALIPPGDKGGYNKEGIGQPTNRAVANNYGYSPHSTIGKVMGALPGVAGLPGKVLSVAENLNNVKAVEKARQTLGMKDTKPTSQMGNLKGAIGGTDKGKVADVKIGDKQYSVGLEATDSQGRTTLTPSEARTRGLMSPTGMQLSTSAEVKAKNAENKKQGIRAESKLPGLMGAVVDAGQKVADKVFDKSPNPTVRETTPSAVTESAPRGLQAVADVTKSATIGQDGNISYNHPERGPWSQNLDEDTSNAVKALAGQVPGGINVTSAYRSPEVNASIGGAPKSAHQKGMAVDISTTGMTPQEKSNLVERAKLAGFAAIGAYSTDTSLHLDTNPRTAITRAPDNMAPTFGMYDRTQNKLSSSPGWFQQGLQQVTVPTPEDKPPAPTTTAPMVATSMPDNVINSAIGQTTPSLQTVDPSTTPSTYAGYGGVSPAIANTPPGAMSPASATALGIGANYTQDDKTAMAAALAGEMGPKALAGLATNPASQKEASSILGTIDNRIQAQPNAVSSNPMASTLGAYDAFKDRNMQTTLNNYKSMAPDVQSAVNNYVSGVAPSTTPGATHYANMGIASPAWAGAPDSTTIGQHTFSTPDQSMKNTTGTYGMGWGPTAGSMVSSPSGTMANPAGTYGSPSNPTGFGSVTGMSPSTNVGMGTTLGGGLSLGGWGGTDSDVAKSTGETAAAASQAAAQSSNAAKSVGSNDADKSGKDSGKGSGGEGKGIGGLGGSTGGTAANSTGAKSQGGKDDKAGGGLF